jgi:hypothetical protein
LLPTRGVRGPGLGPSALGPCGFGGTTEPVEPDEGVAGAWAAGACAAGAAGASCWGFGAGGATGSALATGATSRGAAGCSTGAGAAGGFGPGRGPGRMPPGRGAPPDGAGVAAGAEGAADDGAAGVPFEAGAAGRGGAGVGLAPPLPGYASRSRRATGASTVDDADLTNSPCSLSLARTSLLVTPSSLASSCTRALPGTALLFWGGRRQTRRPRPIVARSCSQLHG